jgi:hypothetical protein
VVVPRATRSTTRCPSSASDAGFDAGRSERLTDHGSFTRA